MRNGRMRKREETLTLGTDAAEQLRLFPVREAASPAISTASLARHFARFLQLQPRWLAGEPAVLSAMLETFQQYLSMRLGAGVAQRSSQVAAAYAERRLWLLWLQSGAIALEAVPADVARQFRRHELRYYLHEVMGHYLKTLRKELDGTGSDDQIPRILAEHIEGLRQQLDALLAEQRPDRPEALRLHPLPTHSYIIEVG